MLPSRHLLACLLLVSASFADDRVATDGAREAAEKQTIVDVSPATTRLTEPLDERGFLDYVAATNAAHAKGVTPENNFEVVVRRVTGLGEISEELAEEYHRRLGIAVPKGPFLADFLAFHGENVRAFDDTDPVWREYEAVQAGPWTVAGHPLAAKWVKAQKPYLDALVAGTKRTRNYTPYVDFPPDPEEADEPFPRMIAMLLPSVQGQRELARSLVIRANMHIGEGDLEAAWEDVLAIKRMARLEARGFSLIEGLVGIAVDALAHEVAVHIVESPGFTPKLARRMLDDLTALPSFPAMADKMDTGERYAALDAVQAMAIAGQQNVFRMLKLINDLSSVDAPARNVAGRFPFATAMASVDDETEEDADEKPGERPAELTINWNITMRVVNAWYDRVVAAARETDFERRTAAQDAVDQDIKKLAAKVRDGGALARKLFGNTPRDVLGEVIGELVVVLFTPAYKAVTTAEQELHARHDVLRLALAVELHHADTGRIPRELQGLAPKYLDRIPLDGLSGKPLYYVRNAGGFTLYSVGRNGENDGGRSRSDRDTSDEDVDWDDVVIRVER